MSTHSSSVFLSVANTSCHTTTLIIPQPHLHQTTVSTELWFFFTQ